mgnify:CR=1 FL=1
MFEKKKEREKRKWYSRVIKYENAWSDAASCVHCSISLRLSRTLYATRQVELGQPSIRSCVFLLGRIVPAMHHIAYRYFEHMRVQARERG